MAFIAPYLSWLALNWIDFVLMIIFAIVIRFNLEEYKGFKIHILARL